VGAKLSNRATASVPADRLSIRPRNFSDRPAEQNRHVQFEGQAMPNQLPEVSTIKRACGRGSRDYLAISGELRPLRVKVTTSSRPLPMAFCQSWHCRQRLILVVGVGPLERRDGAISLPFANDGRRSSKMWQTCKFVSGALKSSTRQRLGCAAFHLSNRNIYCGAIDHQSPQP
jgi:hypothetical protein